jgi:hypothetical protein
MKRGAWLAARKIMVREIEGERESYCEDRRFADVKWQRNEMHCYLWVSHMCIVISPTISVPMFFTFFDAIGRRERVSEKDNGYAQHLF